VFALERDMLVRRGHEVQCFERFSDEIRSKGAYGILAGGLATPWNPFAARAMRRLVATFRPDIVHVHNTFPLLSPAVFSAARGAGRVLTLHNYRLACPAAIPMREGRVCTECIDRRSVLPAALYGCYRGSRMATLPLVANIALQRMRETWTRDVEAFVALTEFQRDKMIQAGLPADRIWVKPNFFPGDPAVAPFDERPRRVVFVGRLSEEKGVDDLVTAWLRWGREAPELRLIGDGPLRAALSARAANAPNVRFLGQLPHAETRREIGMARLLIFPSRWFEAFSLVLSEAFAFGTPSMVSDLGPLPGLVGGGQGTVFRAGNVFDLLEKTQALWADGERLRLMSTAARGAFEFSFNEDVNYSLLMEIYERAAVVAASRCGRG
jgi:glycosyltransferase involved in cell wall biosynthesis